jgi:UDP-N-acetylglucosamine 1-carboxyvinyltransferase
MAKYLVTGGNSLKGRVKIFGAKNSVFKLMLAATLSEEQTTIENICTIRNVFVVKEIVEHLGGRIDLDTEKSVAKVSGSNIKNFEVPVGLGKESRASSMMIPILLHKFGKARVPFPGGDQIGARSLDRHFAGLEKLGAKVSLDGDWIVASSPNGLLGSEYSFEKNTHTGTETLIMAAVLAKGQTILNNAAEEPEVDDLINLVNQMGADVKRVESRKIVINGVEDLKGTVYRAMPDQNEAVTFACASLATKGDILIETAKKEHLQAFINKVVEIGGGFEESPEGLRFFYKQALKATSIETKAYPGFKTDWQALWVTLMTQAEGESIVHETVYESRFGYVTDLVRMGAKIELFAPEVENPEEVYNFNLKDVKEHTPHAARIVGPSKLHGENLFVSDIRAGATLTLAALTAEGESTIENVEMIERGYEKLDERLKSLGAKIDKVG